MSYDHWKTTNPDDEWLGPDPNEEETFTEDQITIAIEQWLDYGEQSFEQCHLGYFSGGGWAARCLRYHLRQREKGRKMVGKESEKK